jgi:BirA family biotin operon repressor/biotin-[acetyl-CoA-carboxylase] ligase
LRILSDADFHSGEAMAQCLGVSRASIWNAMRSLDDAGLVLHKVRGRGYRLPDPPQWLDRESILAALGSKAALFDLEVLDTVESTNRTLMHRAALDAPHASCVVADLQTQGRGRRGRTWHGALGGSLTFSLLWRFQQGAGFLSGLSLAVGVALMRALKAYGVEDAGLKWPNDVLHNYRKLAGVLIELQGDMHGPTAAVIGIGLNVKLPAAVRDRIDQAAVDLFSIGGASLLGRNQLLAHILVHMADVLQEFESEGFSGLREEWVGYHAYHGRNVRMMLPGGTYEEGCVSGVAEDGSLLLATPAGTKRFASGEIGLRPAPSAALDGTVA